jgi:hypothetical protein
VVERIGVPGETLNVLERDALLQEIGDRGDGEGMGREEQGEANFFEAASHHAGRYR